MQKTEKKSPENLTKKYWLVKREEEGGIQTNIKQDDLRSKNFALKRKKMSWVKNFEKEAEIKWNYKSKKPT